MCGGAICSRVRGSGRRKAARFSGRCVPSRGRIGTRASAGSFFSLRVSTPCGKRVGDLGNSSDASEPGTCAFSHGLDSNASGPCSPSPRKWLFGASPLRKGTARLAARSPGNRSSRQHASGASAPVAREGRAFAGVPPCRVVLQKSVGDVGLREARLGKTESSGRGPSQLRVTVAGETTSGSRSRWLSRGTGEGP
jgi:hypothetical protein